MRTLAILVFATIVWASNVDAQTITECGESEGYAYYFPGGVVSKQEAGIRKDGISGGHIILNFENNEVDLIIKHAMGSTYSVKQQDAQIALLPSNEGLIALSVLYKNGIVENYIFQLDKGGNGTVVWSGMRTNSAINKLSLMQSHCVGPRR